MKPRFHSPLLSCLSFLALTALNTMAQTTPSTSYGDPLSANVPQTREALWAGIDVRTEPLDVEVLKEWEQDGVVLKVLRYRVGVFKGQKAMMAAVYGYPKGASKLPGLVQIHGGGSSLNTNKSWPMPSAATPRSRSPGRAGSPRPTTM